MDVRNSMSAIARCAVGVWARQVRAVVCACVRVYGLVGRLRRVSSLTLPSFWSGCRRSAAYSGGCALHGH